VNARLQCADWVCNGNRPEAFYLPRLAGNTFSDGRHWSIAHPRYTQLGMSGSITAQAGVPITQICTVLDRMPWAALVIHKADIALSLLTVSDCRQRERLP
jgi:hypothetical protein